MRRWRSCCLGLWDPSSGNLFAEEGDQQRFWKITRRFVEQMSSIHGADHVKAVCTSRPVFKVLRCAMCIHKQGLLPRVQLYPDVGVAAMLRNEWKDATFEIGAVSDKTAVGEGDDLVIIAAVDPQGMPSNVQAVQVHGIPATMLMWLVLVADRVERGKEGGGGGRPARSRHPLQPAAGQVGQLKLQTCCGYMCSACCWTDSSRAMLLCSGDVGIGLNVRRMRLEFLSTFTVTYSLRPLGEFGTVLRRYPGQWQVGCRLPDTCAAARWLHLLASIQTEALVPHRFS